MKITRATLKSFIKKAFQDDNLYVKTLSNFDGMVDGVRETQDTFRKVNEVDFAEQHHFNIKGLWLVGQSRDYFTKYLDNQYAGIEIYNCCGSSLIASKI